MKNIEKHKNRLELFKKYFKEESLKEIKKEETIATLSQVQ